MKVLIIAVSLLLCVSLTFGITISKSFQWFENIIFKFGKVANSVAEISGGDTNSSIPLFVPLLNHANLGTYYDENTQEIYNVVDLIKMRLPTWLRVSDGEQCVVKVFPTFYSITLNYVFEVISPYNFALSSTGSNLTSTIQRYSISRAIRLYVTVFENYKSINYDLYMFYDYKFNQVAFFCTRDGEYEGFKSFKLNSYSQWYSDIITNKRTVNSLLNSAYKVDLDNESSSKDNDIYKFRYYSVGDIMDTTDPLWIDMSDFIPNL